MNLFALENLLITIFCITLAYLIYKYADNKAHRLWAYFNCAVTTWAFSIFLVGMSTTPSQAIIFWKTAYVGATFIGVGFYHFVNEYYKLNRKKTLTIFYIQAFIFSYLFLFTDLLINKISLIFNIYYHVITPYFNVWFILWGIIVLSAFYEFIIQLIKNKNNRIPSLIIFWAMFIGFIGGTSATIRAYGWWTFYPGWQISICLYALMIGYGIFYHQLLPIDIIIKRGIIYSILVTIISLTYLLSILVSQQLFNQYFGYSSTIIGSIIIAIAFIPLRNLIQNFIDKFFFKSTPVQIAQENILLRKEILQTEKLKAVATLASGMAHEIKNPLTVLKSFAEYLPQKMNDKDFLKKFAPMITQEVNRIDDLVHELLDFARPVEPVLKPTDLHHLLKNTIELLSNEYIKRNIKIYTDYPLNTDIKILLDQNQIKQALLNILLNAIEAMPQGGQLNINSSISLQTNKISIRIQDSGVGIDEKDLPHIFDPFFSKKDGGTGLGLAITYEIIKKNGGKIFVESIKEKGTTFILEFSLITTPPS